MNNASAYNHLPSDPSPLVTAQPVSYYSQLYQTLSGYENILFPAAKPHTYRTDSFNNLSGFQDMSHTHTWTDRHSISQWTCCVSCQDT